MRKSTLNRRRFLAHSGAGCLALGQWRLAGESAALNPRPELRFDDPGLQALHGTAFNNALQNLLVTNTLVDSKNQYNRTGLFAIPPGRFIRAGGNYETPWTRDASINSWNAASLLSPTVARNTLWAVCERQANGRLIIQRDNQWWDKVIWAQGAWNHFLVTGDRVFLAHACEAVTESLAEMRQTHFNKQFGLFEGPSVLCDGIAGYPEPPYNPKVSSSFILDHPGGDKLMCLSTNCVMFQAYRCAAAMAGELGKPPAERTAWTEHAAALRQTINRNFWMPEKTAYAYFIHGAGPLAGKLDASQEGMGLAYAILFDVASPEQVRDIIRTVHLQPKGIVCVWPHFARFNDARPGRHNVLVWPMASGMWAHAAAKAGSVEYFTSEITNVATMAKASNGIFYEIYHSVTGVPDGGWQVGKRWNSCIHQTWSATAYLRMIFYGLFGIHFEPEGVRFSPTLPPGWGGVRLTGLRYRNTVLNVRIEGEGQRLASVSGTANKDPFVSANADGEHTLTIRLKA